MALAAAAAAVLDELRLLVARLQRAAVDARAAAADGSSGGGGGSGGEGATARRKRQGAALAALERARSLADEVLRCVAPSELGGNDAAGEVGEVDSGALERWERGLDAVRRVAARVDPAGAMEAAGAEEASTAAPPPLSAADEAALAAVCAAGRAADAEALRGIVRALRAVEARVDFHAGLARAAQSAAFERAPGDELAACGSCGSVGGGSSYSRDNFAYGSTPFSSFASLFAQCGALALAAMRAGGGGGAEDRGAEIVVWGSSVGWMVFYAALGLGCRARGVELLPALDAVARGVALREAHALAGRATLECGDLMRSDVSRASAVVLASQCWDEPLVAAAAAKLAVELPVDAAVVDYRCEAMLATGAFELVHEARLSVSWNDSQGLYVFVKR